MIFMVAAILSLWFCIPWISSDIKFLSTMHKMIGSNENLKKEMVTYSERYGSKYEVSPLYLFQFCSIYSCLYCWQMAL